ncbi:hypothetical protein, partial [Pseudomonas indica]|uniref:hypothetical protein n=1 Tax=Pseudomonas indica TaxID=137658 RepID=UPI0023F82F85
PPYPAVLDLVHWAAQPGIWHELDGRAAAAGIDPGDLPAHRFLNWIYAEMVQRLSGRENEKPEAARKRFDGQLSVRNWATPGTEHKPSQQSGRKTPWWWNSAEEASQPFMELARAKGMIK